MTYEIIFEWTDKSNVTAQGAEPSGLPGYNVWIQYADSEYVDFLGFISENEVYGEIEYYKSVGITPKMRG